MARKNIEGNFIPSADDFEDFLGEDELDESLDIGFLFNDELAPLLAVPEIRDAVSAYLEAADDEADWVGTRTIVMEKLGSDKMPIGEMDFRLGFVPHLKSIKNAINGAKSHADGLVLSDAREKEIAYQEGFEEGQRLTSKTTDAQLDHLWRMSQLAQEPDHPGWERALKNNLKSRFGVK